ncbi:MAG: response regulator [Arcobacteraceae bacterium]|jgi:two-component system chemotaxis response regulator CheY|nr:response regulator [Arcobacteraceae bacterium]
MAKILIVDDAKIMRMSIKNMLNDLGHKVIGEADSGYSAIEEYKRLKPDIVTMDITMPQENDIADGIEAVKQIMAFDKNAKIVMITSHGEQEKVIKAIQSGASNYLLKPLKMDRLKEVLDKLSY